MTAFWLFGAMVLLNAPAQAQQSPSSDLDQDGILDSDDRCPSLPETLGTAPPADGCPDTLGWLALAPPDQRALLSSSQLLSTLRFPPNQVGLSADNALYVKQIARRLDLDRSVVALQLIAHASPDETPSLGTQRCEVVRAQLVADGAGLGEKASCLDLGTRAWRAGASGRVEVVVVTAPTSGEGQR